MTEPQNDSDTTVDVKRVDHIGIAVEQISGALSVYEDLLGMELKGIEDVEEEQVRTAFLDTENANIELLEPLDDDGPVKKFLKKHGPGIHHVCLSVDDLETMTKQLQEAGCNPIYSEPRTGAEQAKINFLHPDDTFGVLLELREHAN